jgi:hypothetical protein
MTAMTVVLGGLIVLSLAAALFLLCACRASSQWSEMERQRGGPAPYPPKRVCTHYAARWRDELPRADERTGVRR